MASLEFSLKIFKLLSKGDNSVFSPFSLTTCLAMVLMGTRNTSFKQLSQTMFGRIISDKEFQSLATDFKSYFDRCIPDNSDAIISTNLMYSDSRFDVLSAFKQLIQKYFSSNIKELDFFNKSASIDVINSDISKATKGKIPKLLEYLSDETVIVLANALYFKGFWKNRFVEQYMGPEKFTTNSGQQIPVQMMFQSEKHPFGYSPHLKAKAIELNYENTNAVMIVLLPDIYSSLQQMRDKLTVQTINDLVLSLRTVTVDLYLPRFKIQSEYDLIPSMKNMGITDIFERNADFSGISQRSGLIVSQVIQKAIIEVNEEGTEAAAATASGICLGAVINEVLRVDRPFMYLLVTKNTDKQIDSLLFMGECVNPSE